MPSELSLAFRRIAAERTGSAAAVLIIAFTAGLAGPLAGAVHRLTVAPLGYPDPHRLVRIIGRSADGAAETNVSPPDFRDLRRESRTLAAVAAVSPFAAQLTHTGEGTPELLTGRLMSAGYFATIGVPVTGREFGKADEQPPRKLVVLGERWWKRRLHARPNVVGSTIELNGELYEVVGIAADREEVFAQPDVWLPMQFPSEQIRDLRFVAVVARMRPDSGLETVREELRRLGTALQARFPATNARWMPDAVPLSESIAGPARPVARLIAVIAALLSLSAVVSLFLLSVARGQQRAADDRIRVALGATRWRLVRALVLEQAIVGAAGLALAGVVGQWGYAALVRLGVLRGTEALSAPVIAAGAGACVLLALLASACAVPRTSPASLAAGRAADPDRARRLDWLVAAHCLLAVAALALASSAVAGARSVRHAALGFDPSGLVFARLHLPPRYTTPAERERFWAALLEEVGATPGVAAAAVTSELPFTGQENATAFKSTTRDRRHVQTHIRSVSPEYFELTRIAVLEGDPAAPPPTATAAPAVFINRAFQRQAFGDASGIGETLEFNFVSPPFVARVAGVVADVRHTGPAVAVQPEAYFPAAQTPLNAYTLLMRTSLAPTSLHAALRAIVQQMDGDVAVPVPRRWEEAVAERYRLFEWRAGVTATTGLLMLLIAGAATYATARQAATTRLHEYAIRVALGAPPASVARGAMGRLLRVTLASALAGGVAGYVLIVFAGARLEGIGRAPVQDCLLAAAAVVLVTIIALWRPTRAVLATDPAMLLRK